jgi:hypothetical protein
MSHCDELPKVIDKSQADIDAAIAAIKASDIPGGTQDFAYGWQFGYQKHYLNIKSRYSICVN